MKNKKHKDRKNGANFVKFSEQLQEAFKELEKNKPKDDIGDITRFYGLSSSKVKAMLKQDQHQIKAEAKAGKHVLDLLKHAYLVKLFKDSCREKKNDRVHVMKKVAA